MAERVTTQLTARETLASGWIMVPLAGLAVLVGTGAVVSPPLVLFGVLGLAFVAASTRSLAAGVAAFTVLIFFSRIPAVSGSGVTVVKLAGGVLALAWLAAILRRHDRPPLLFRDHPAFTYVTLLFLGWTLASVLWAPDADIATSDAFRVLQVVVLMFIVFSAIERRGHLLWVVWAFVGGAAVSAIVGLAGATSPERFNPGRETQRLTGGIGDPNQLAAILVPALVFALFALAISRRPLARVLLLGSAAVSALALFRTESRGGIVALGVTFLAALVLSGPVRPYVVPVILAVTGAGVFYYTLVAPPESLARIAAFRAGGGSGREDLWTVAVEVARDHPVLGVGIGNLRVVEPAYAIADIDLRYVKFVAGDPQVAHNTYLNLLAELGVVGLVAFLAVLGSALVVAFRAVRVFKAAGDREMEILARGLLIGTIGMLAAFFFISEQYGKQLPLLLGVMTALFTLATVARRESESDAHAQPETGWERGRDPSARPRPLLRPL